MTKSAPKAPAVEEASAPENQLILADKAQAAKEAVTDSADKVVSFVKAHPVAVIAGGIAAGVVVSALLPRRSSRKVLGKALKLAELAGAASMLVGEGAGAAKVVGAGARKGAGSLGSTLGKAGIAALGAAASIGKATASKAGDVGHSAGVAAEKIRERLVH